MNTWVRKSFKVGVLSAGVLLFAGNAANADWNSVGNSGVGSGNQANTTTQAPVDVCGNAIGVLGNASASCVGGSWASLGGDSGNWNSVGNSGVGSGNQINTSVQAPIDVCGNAVGLFGNAQASCVGGSWATMGGGNGGNCGNGGNGGNGGYGYATPGHANKAAKVKAHQVKNHHILATAAGTESAHVLEAGSMTSVGNSGVGSGNQASTTLQLPIDVCGNAIGVVGNAQASCVGGANASTGGGGGGTTMNSGFNSGIASGNQVTSLVQVPINVCGNAIGLFGNAQASCFGGSSATTGGGNGGGNGGGYSDGEAGKAKGAAKAHVYGGNTPGGGCSSVMNSFGNSGVGSGNQANTTIQTPVEISGNAIGALGNTSAFSVGGAWASSC